MFVSEQDIQEAICVLAPVLAPTIRRDFYQKKTLDRLQRVLSRPLRPEDLLECLVRSHGSGLLAARNKKGAAKRTQSVVRKRLLENLDDDALQKLYSDVRKDTKKTLSRNTIIKNLASFNWHRGSSSAFAFVDAFRLPRSFAGTPDDHAYKERFFDVPSRVDVPPLKPFQRGMLNEVRQRLQHSGRIMVSSFTGTGKTRVGMECVARHLSDRDGEDAPPVALWVAQKHELIDQACGAIEELWPWINVSGTPLRVIVFSRGKSFHANDLPSWPTLVVATSHQLQMRVSSDDQFTNFFLGRVSLMVIDEAHYALAPGHRMIIESHQKLRGENRCLVLGLSATPGRSNIAEPTESYQLANLFHRRLIVPNTGGARALRWFQSRGYLSKLSHRELPLKSQIPQTLGKRKIKNIYTSDDGDRDITGEVLGIIAEDSLRNRGILRVLKALYQDPDRSTLVFCCNIRQAELLTQAMILSGMPCEVIHHKIDKRDRRGVVQKFRIREIPMLLNVEILTTGFDAPKTNTIVMCRPTFSRILYEQMIGRGMRGPGMGGTETCEIIDFTDNFEFYEEPRAWEAFWKEWNLHTDSNEEFEQWDVIFANESEDA